MNKGVKTKHVSFKPHGIWVFTETALKTLKYGWNEQFYDLLIIDIISLSMAGRTKKLNGLHMVPGP